MGGTPTPKLRVGPAAVDIWGVVFGLHLALSGDNNGTLRIYRHHSSLRSAAEQGEPTNTEFVATLATNLRGGITVRPAASIHWGTAAFTFFGSPLFSPSNIAKQL